MASETSSNGVEFINLETMNRHLLENQSLLYHENQKLHKDIAKLSKDLEHIRNNSEEPEVINSLKKEKEHLIALNETLRKKIRRLRTPSASMDFKDIENEHWEKQELAKSVKDLNALMQRIKESEKLDVKPPEQNIAKVVASLTKKLEEQQRKYEEANETIRRLRDDDEKYVLKERINDMKQLITDLELENAKLKFESEQLSEDVESFKKQLNETAEEVKSVTKKCYQLEDEKEQMKATIRELEDEKIRVKKEMIEEMNDANRAKRVSVELEIALHHVSDAYEHKRQEVTAMQKQLDDAEKIIRNFKDQLEPTLNAL